MKFLYTLTTLLALQNEPTDPEHWFIIKLVDSGSFTPGLGLSSGSFAHTDQVGIYSRVGNRVYFQLECSYSSFTGSGNVAIGGLPFTAGNANVYYSGVSIGLNNNFGTAISGGYVSGNSTDIILTKSGNSTQLTHSDIGSPGGIVVSGTYFL